MFRQHQRQTRILPEDNLNLEDTLSEHLAPSRLRDREALLLHHRFSPSSSIAATAWVPFHEVALAELHARSRVGSSTTRKVVIHPLVTHQPQLQEFNMSARNGDKSRFHRERKQKIAKRQRTSELLRRKTSEHKSVDASVRKSHPVAA